MRRAWLLLPPLLLAQAARALPVHEWHAGEVPAALLARAQAAARTADFAAGYSMPAVQVSHRAEAGMLTTHVTLLMAFGDAEASSQHGNAYVAFDEQAAGLSIDAAFVLRPDGTVQAVDHATVQSVSNDSDVFSDWVSLVLPLPGLEPRSIAVVDYTRRERLDRRVYPWGQVSYLRRDYPVDAQRVELSWDTGSELSWATDDPALVKCSEGERTVVCEVGKQAALPPGETANYHDLVPQLSIAQRRDWEDLWQTTQRVVDSALAAPPELAQIARELRAASASDAAFVARAHDFVARHIRYVGIEQGEHGFVPHRTSQTLQRRFGDCKDMAALLIELLRMGGIAARPVLVGTEYERSERLLLPNQAYFDHMVACVDEADGRTRCLDPTDSYSSGRHLPAQLQGRVNLGMDGARPARFPRDRYRWRVRVATTNTIGADGGVLERQSRDFIGPWAGAMRGSLQRRDGEERTRYLVDGYRGMIGNDDARPRFEVQQLEGFEQPLRVSSELEYPEMVAADEALNYHEQLGWLRTYLGDFRPDNEVYPYEFEGFEYRDEVAFVVAENWSPSLSATPELRFRSRFGRVDREIVRDGKTLAVRTTVRLPRASIGPADLPAFKRFLDAIADNTRIDVKGALRAD